MFLLFGGSRYYPHGGWRDLKGCFATVEDAISAACTMGYDWFHVVAGMEIVYSGGDDH